MAKSLPDTYPFQCDFGETPVINIEKRKVATQDPEDEKKASADERKGDRDGCPGRIYSWSGKGW